MLEAHEIDICSHAERKLCTPRDGQDRSQRSETTKDRVMKGVVQGVHSSEHPPAGGVVQDSRE